MLSWENSLLEGISVDQSYYNTNRDPLSIPGLSYLIDDRCAVGKDRLSNN